MRFTLPILALSLLLAVSVASADTLVTFDTNVGSFQVQLFADTPVTTANFLNYATTGRYDNTMIHRSVPGFIIQGGGYTYTDEVGYPEQIPADPAIVNEFNHSNVRGTIAMAKLGGDPNSATSEWFFNLADNSGNLDTQNSGFTVFGQVIGDGMNVIDAIAAMEVVDAGGSPFDTLPIHDYSGTGYLSAANLVIVNSITVTPEPATLALLGIGGLAMLRRARSRR